MRAGVDRRMRQHHLHVAELSFIMMHVCQWHLLLDNWATLCTEFRFHSHPLLQRETTSRTSAESAEPVCLHDDKCVMSPKANLGFPRKEILSVHFRVASAKTLQSSRQTNVSGLRLQQRTSTWKQANPLP